MKRGVSLIVAVAEGSMVIGKDNDLIWYLPKDLKYFKDTTENHHVIMGRKNYLSIPDKYRPLKGRTNVVITRQEAFEAAGSIVMNNIEAGIEYALKNGDAEPFIIGGGQVYKYVLDNDLVDRMYITWVHADFEGDTFFPEFDEAKWELVSSERHEPDHRNKHPFTFAVYEKK